MICTIDVFSAIDNGITHINHGDVNRLFVIYKRVGDDVYLRDYDLYSNHHGCFEIPYKFIEVI